MKKDYRAAVVEFVATLSDEEVRFVASRLSDRYAGDMADALNYLSSKPAVDTILGSASNAEEFFDYCDGVREVAYKEIKRRAATLVAAGEFDPRQNKQQGDRPPRQFHDGPRPPRQHNGGGQQDRPYKTYQKRAPQQSPPQN
jgi:hypothetical protein